MNRPPLVPKLCGADVELGNFINGREGYETGPAAARRILAEIDGFPRSRSSGWSDWSDRSMDWGRCFLATNGGCAYIDLGHLEICLPEVTSAFDHVACWHAMLREVREAVGRAERKLPEGESLSVLVNSSDGHGNAYGSHLDFLIARTTWEEIFRRRLHHMLFLASFQVSSILLSGQGKVGSENGAPPADYQISQRADFFEQVSSLATTHHRGIVNRRDEPLCGRRGDEDLARLHVIFHDSNLCPAASLLKVGATQIVLAMLEAGEARGDLVLDDPVGALQIYSHDPGLAATALLVDGRRRSALELQIEFLEAARRFAARGDLDGIVPRHGEILDLWGDTLARLERHDFDGLAGRLDWVLKRLLIERAISARPGLGWDSPEAKHLDHLYSHLDLEQGLYWACERGGVVERVVADEAIERFRTSPPEDTRAWTRAMLLRRAGDRVSHVDWDSVRVRASDDAWARGVVVSLDDPLAHGREESGPHFAGRRSLEDLLEALGARAERPARTWYASWTDEPSRNDRAIEWRHDDERA